jgi:hypothetical protein
MLFSEIEFDAPTHTYRHKGAVLPSVTQLIAWMNNYAGVPAQLLEDARALGDAVHIATALHDRDNLVEESVHEEVRPYLDAYRQFREDLHFVPYLIEQKVFSAKHGYAGTLDRTGYFAPNPCTEGVLIDLKTAAKIMPANGPQTAAYKQCLVESSYLGAARLKRYTLLLTPGTSPPYKLKAHTDPNDLNAFLNSLGLHAWRVNNRFKE